LQTVAICFNVLQQIDSAAPSGPPVANGFKLWQSVADPKKTG
jgi:hypothetical protein